MTAEKPEIQTAVYLWEAPKQQKKIVLCGKKRDSPGCGSGESLQVKADISKATSGITVNRTHACCYNTAFTLKRKEHKTVA